MTSTIYNNDGKAVAQSHNLRAILRGAGSYGGVRRIAVLPANMPACGMQAAPAILDGGGNVTVYYGNGYIGKTVFVSHSHAVDWAFDRSHLPARVSAFAGCDVYAPHAKLDAFATAYIDAALWSTTASNGTALDEYFDRDDLDADTRASMVSDCRDFQHTNRALLRRAYDVYLSKMGDEHAPAARAGHDFWLTRNGHGAGFWDRGLGKIGDELTTAAKLAGSFDLDEYNMTESARACAGLESNEGN
jgi:hypothetical protein